MPRVRRSTRPAGKVFRPPASKLCANWASASRLTMPFRCAEFVFWTAGLPSKRPSNPARVRALRRTRLHDLLAGRASELGVRLLWGTHMSDSSAFSSCRWIVGADGNHSRVRHAAGLDAASSESFRFGFRRHYRISPWTDFVEVHWGSRCQLYVTPVSRDEVGIALLSRDSHLRLDTALREFPELQRKTSGRRGRAAPNAAP